MLVRVKSAFRVGGKVLEVGDVVDLASPFAAEMIFCNKAELAPEPPPKPKRGRPRKKESVSDENL